ncbi:MAG TPA: hypothetical protein VK069_08740 [Mycolicibacillus parakoreensis]|nr:hypothetical protein [Mycolicibacillus parakoreensis]
MDHDAARVEAAGQQDRRFVAKFGTACLVAVLALAAVIAAASGRFALALLALGAAGFWAFAFVLIARAATFTPQWSVDATGTTVSPNRRAQSVGPALMVSLPLLVVAATALVYLRPDEVGFLGDQFVADARFALPLAAGGTAVFTLAHLLVQLRRGGRDYLRFTPEGFEFATGFTTAAGRWTQVRAVLDRTPYRELGPRRAPLYGWQAGGVCPITLVLDDGATPFVGDLRGFAPDTHRLREWVRFYWRHPRLRGELATPRALERLRHNAIGDIDEAPVETQ